jgi:hypothetical protein
MDLLFLFAFIVLPPPLMALLGAWLWQLSRQTALPGVERYVRLAGILLTTGWDALPNQYLRHTPRATVPGPGPGST